MQGHVAKRVCRQAGYKGCLLRACRFSIFLNRADCFDAAAFAISDNEALLMDPQQRLLLEATGEALLAAGPAAGDIGGAGVFVGITSTEYGQLAQVRRAKDSWR
jgi:acyl transferase domain-containing protein